MQFTTFLSHVLWWPHFAVGAMLCLAGWTLYWAGLNLAGGCLGAAIAGTLCWLGARLGEVPPNQVPWFTLVSGMMGMLCGIFFARRLHSLFFFSTGGLLGMFIGWNLFQWTQTLGRHFLESRGVVLEPFAAKFILTSTLSLACGILMLFMSKWMVAALTSLTGALLLALSLRDPLALFAVPPVALGSFFFQIGVLRRFSNNRMRENVQEE